VEDADLSERLRALEAGLATEPAADQEHGLAPGLSGPGTPEPDLAEPGLAEMSLEWSAQAEVAEADTPPIVEALATLPATRGITLEPRAFSSVDATDAGGVVVLAGIGGPDAVRQLLAALPGGFSRPVLVRQRLDGGRHDRLVRQMQRATALPVELAEAGASLAGGHVYILPDGITTTSGLGTPVFTAAEDPVPVLAGLPAADSAILMLSGSDASLVGEVLDAARAGALVAGQSPEECFDSEAPSALLAAGGESATPAVLAERLGTRWLSLKD
jgi:chemotaxis response regulator CheB